MIRRLLSFMSSLKSIILKNIILLKKHKKCHNIIIHKGKATTGKLISAISQVGLRAFNKHSLPEVTIKIGLKKNYVPCMITLMVQNRKIGYLGKGLYSLPPELLAGGTPHSFEIVLNVN